MDFSFHYYNCHWTLNGFLSNMYSKRNLQRAFLFLEIKNCTGIRPFQGLMPLVGYALSIGFQDGFNSMITGWLLLYYLFLDL